MVKVIEERCVVAAEGGEVMLECGHAAVSLTPAVAHHAADELHKHAHLAADQAVDADDEHPTD